MTKRQTGIWISAVLAAAIAVYCAAIIAANYGISLIF